MHVNCGIQFYPSFSENSTVVLQVPGFPLPSHLQDGGPQKFVKKWRHHHLSPPVLGGSGELLGVGEDRWLLGWVGMGIGSRAQGGVVSSVCVGFMTSIERCRCSVVTLWVGVSAVSLRGGADLIVRCLDVIGVSLGREPLGLKLGRQNAMMSCQLSTFYLQDHIAKTHFSFRSEFFNTKRALLALPLYLVPPEK